MDPLRTYATTWHRDPDNNFAVACYEQNSLTELEDAATAPQADAADMDAWGITDPQEWYAAIHAARQARGLA